MMNIWDLILAAVLLLVLLGAVRTMIRRKKSGSCSCGCSSCSGCPSSKSSKKTG
ncbi:MAG: FeoB-associated Cys-rich membrane protein [Blautia sp.]|nr:FeoB-associated Cys-rich membrane protein [Blautia sp.]